MKHEQTFDYIVIGGGSSGCIVAARLASESKSTVLLLEKGGDETESPEILAADGFKEAFANDNTMLDRLSTPQGELAKRPIYAGSGKSMGGSGSVNGTVYTRGDKRDFANWPENWQWQENAPFYEKLEAQLRVRFRKPTHLTERCIDAAKSIGFEQKNSLNDGELSGFIGYNDMNFEGELRRSSYVAFIRDHRDDLESLTIKHYSTASRILFDADNKAIGIDYLENGQLRRAHVNKEIILTAGALETPKLLMLSGIGPQAELEKHGIVPVHISENIGKNLQDHPMVCIFYKGNQKSDFGYPQLYGFHRFNTGSYLPEGQADTCVTLFAASSVMQKTLHRMMPLMVLPQSLYKISGFRRFIRGCVDVAFKLPPLQSFVSRLYGIVVILGKPLSRGELRLKSVNALDAAEIDVAYFRNPEDLQTIKMGIEKIKKMMTHSSMKAWGNKLVSKAAYTSNEKSLQKWIEGSVATSFHFSGTCKMGNSEADPVDSQLRLRGTQNIRVADASVIPEIPVSALNAPSMMIGYRAAEFILNKNES